MGARYGMWHVCEKCGKDSPAASMALSSMARRNDDYRNGETHHTNHVELFWRMFKASVRGTHIHISSQHMSRYLGEFSFRSTHREMQNAMFDLLLGAI